MIDPFNALISFQEEFSRGHLKLQPGSLYPNLYAYLEMFEGDSFRFTYVRIENSTVIAFVNFVRCEPIQRTPSVQIGYAVPKAYQNRGLAKNTIKMAISELQYGWRRAGIATFYVEAIVGAENKPSQRVAEQVISSKPVSISDEFKGLPAFQYIKKVE